MSIARLAAVSLALAVAGTAAGATAVLGAKPETERSGRVVETFADDFILELCGIETMTTVTEHWTLTTYADGSQRFRDTRTFVSDDPRLPIEQGAGMSYWDADGVQTVHGSPIRLRRPGGGIILLDAGRVVFSDPPVIRGPHPSLGMDLAGAYCP
jgi:uncharacterized protein Veg